MDNHGNNFHCVLEDVKHTSKMKTSFNFTSKKKREKNYRGHQGTYPAPSWNVILSNPLKLTLTILSIKLLENDIV